MALPRPPPPWSPPICGPPPPAPWALPIWGPPAGAPPPPPKFIAPPRPLPPAVGMPAPPADWPAPGSALAITTVPAGGLTLLVAIGATLPAGGGSGRVNMNTTTIMSASTTATMEMIRSFWFFTLRNPRAKLDVTRCTNRYSESQCRKCRSPVKAIAIPSSSAALITASSFLLPPG